MIKAGPGEIPNKLSAQSFRGLRRQVILLMNRSKGITFQFQFLKDDEGWHAIYYARLTDKDILEVEDE